MKKLLKLGVVAAIACVFCFALVGCGSGKTETIDGNWEISGGSSFDKETLETMKSLDMNVILVINTDGTCSFDIFGYYVADGTWTDNGNNTYSFTFSATDADVSDFDATLSGDKLTIDAEGEKMELSKGGSDLKTTLENDRANMDSLTSDTTTS